MGGAHHNFERYDWQLQRRAGNTANYDIVRDSRTGIHAERHIIKNNPTYSDEDEMNVYHYRNLTRKPIVKVYDAQHTNVRNKARGACGADKDIVVHSEYIPYRLSDVRNLNMGQALYVTNQALAGFQELHHRFGPFQVTDDHIGFNQIGQVKVWHNPNFATNHMEHDNIVLMSTRNPYQFDQRMQHSRQNQMVYDILRAVGRHSNIGMQLGQNLFHEKGFSDARRIVYDQITSGGTYVPDYLNFRQNIFNQSQINNFQNIMGNSNARFNNNVGLQGSQIRNQFYPNSSNVNTFQQRGDNMY